jgi:chemotaxis protein CheY-P-specific phosphatase CheC
MGPDRSTGASVGRVRELARIGADRAATAFATLLGRKLHAHEPRVRAPLEVLAAGETGVGIVFEMEGTLQGLIALLLPPLERQALVAAVCPEAGAGSELAESALREVANIIASQAVSAVADHLGGRITLSVPLLVEEEAGGVVAEILAERLAARPAIATESELRESAGGHRALLIFAPEPG